MTLMGNRDLIAQRDRQLAILLEAVEQARRAARALCNSREDADRAGSPRSRGDRAGGDDIELLVGRLEAVRIEVEQLRRGNGMGPFKEIDPKWTGLVPWRLLPD